MEISAFSLAGRFVGIKEASGPTSNAHVLAMLQLDAKWPEDDSVPWCSGFANYIAWLLRLPRSKSLAARSWLAVGTPIQLAHAAPENDVVVLRRGSSPTAGHVGFFAGLERHASGTKVLVLGGNQGDQVSLADFDIEDVLGVRRLA